jgi:hypothetical protein
MIARRQFLLGSVSTATLGAVRPAFAIVPVILAALAAITLLAAATSKAAEAIEKVVTEGRKLRTDIASIADEETTRRELKEKQEIVTATIGIRREVVREGLTAQVANAAVVTSIRHYLVTRDTNAWNSVVPAMTQAVSALGAMAAVFREKAVWFPVEAQDSLAELSNLYERRVSIISDLQHLSADTPPTTDEELSAWSKLVDAYDHLRVQSLKLIKALDSYIS